MCELNDLISLQNNNKQQLQYKNKTWSYNLTF